MSNILIIAEHNGKELNSSTAKCVTCAKKIHPDSIDVVVLAADSHQIATEAAALEGVSKVIRVDHPVNEYPLAATLAPQIIELANKYTHILGPSTTFGRDLMPRVAALLGVGQLSDIMGVENAYRFKRPIYAGNVIVTVEAPSDRILIATIRSASFAASEQTGNAIIEKYSINVDLPKHTSFLDLRSDSGSSRPDLQTATKVVSGGRALGSKDNFDLIYELADVIGGAVGASRAAVDSGYVGNDLQVGQTGKIIAPDLYIALGISGAIQHLTGMKDSGTIVAINKDEDAPIFEIADFGLVEDLFTAIPDLIAALEK
ncbi:MAG: electron transfer flavoprotein subunit alpha [Rhodospirillaceae bacterium]|nr:electron transfer flavoprotein subunit alpha [Rhodospirillaceae bacterium]